MKIDYRIKNIIFIKRKIHLKKRRNAQGVVYENIC